MLFPNHRRTDPGLLLHRRYLVRPMDLPTAFDPKPKRRRKEFPPPPPSSSPAIGPAGFPVARSSLPNNNARVIPPEGSPRRHPPRERVERNIPCPKRGRRDFRHHLPLAVLIRIPEAPRRRNMLHLQRRRRPRIPTARARNRQVNTLDRRRKRTRTTMQHPIRHVPIPRGGERQEVSNTSNSMQEVTMDTGVTATAGDRRLKEVLHPFRRLPPLIILPGVNFRVLPMRQNFPFRRLGCRAGNRV